MHPGAGDPRVAIGRALPAADTAGHHPSVVEQTIGVWLGLGAVKQKRAPPAVRLPVVRAAAS